jgi:hypothetical protein
MQNPIFMKRTSTLFIFLFIVVLAQSQRVDLDKFNFSVSYRNFPAEPLPQAYKTYNIRIEAAPSLGIGYSTSSLTNEILIEGLKKTEGTGHITVLLILDDLVFERSEGKERIQISKDRSGNEIKKSFFSTELTYSFSARASVYDYKGNNLISSKILFDREQKRTYKTSEFNSPAEATDYYTNKGADLKYNLGKQLTAGVVQQLNAWLNSQYGYPEQRVNDILWVLNNKRHATYQEHQKAWNDFKNAIVLVNADNPVSKVKEKMKPVIDFYEKVKKQYTTTDKDDRKLRYSAYYNLAKIYLYLDEPEKAKAEADALAMNDYDERDGAYLRSMAEALDEMLRKNNASTRHFAVNTTSYEPPVK